MIEIQKVVDLGYRIVAMYEVHHREATNQYDLQTGKGGLFAEYVNRFLRIKEMVSGWPEWCKK